jgi:hypothetical protein
MATRHNYDPAKLFRLHVKLSGGTLVVTAWESDQRQYSTSYTKIDIEARWLAKGSARSKRGAAPVLFERGMLYVGIPGHRTIDGKYAREAVLSAVAMRPGDTDSDYFEGYTSDQLEWASAYGEELSCEATGRYGEF